MTRGAGGPEVYEGVVQNLIDELGQLPGVGPKGAQRIAFYLLSADPADVRRLASSLIEVLERVKFCRSCGNVAEEDECRICRDPRRDPAMICVVEEPKDVAAIEKIREFRGPSGPRAGPGGRPARLARLRRRPRTGGRSPPGAHGMARTSWTA